MEKQKIASCLAWILFLLSSVTEAFTPHRRIFEPKSFSVVSPKNLKSLARSREGKIKDHVWPSRSMCLQATPSSMLSSAPLIKSSAAILIASCVGILLFTTEWAQKWFWPNTDPDPAYSEPLPVGTFGCPFLGFNILGGNSRQGPESFYFSQSQKLGHPRLWKFYFLGRPVVNVSGASLVKQLLNREFDGTIGGKPRTKEEIEKRRKRPSVYGVENIAFERDKEKHGFLRRLIGAGIQNSKPLPMLQQAAKRCIESMQKSKQSTVGSVVKIQDYAEDYTLEFVQRKLLGIDWDGQKVRGELEIWMKKINSLVLSLGIPFVNRRSKAFKAKMYLEQKIEEKINLLEINGPDGSILSSMLFAVDEGNNNSAKLTRNEVVENALFLVAAGAETTASTLTLAILFLGLHPEKYQKLVQEQAAFRDTEVTEEQLYQSPYLDAVIKETMRIGPISGGFPRPVSKTLVVDGKQIPKGWALFGSIRLTHQLDPKTWEPDQAHMDPLTGFRPERWLVPSEDQPKDFLPFGAGPRYCLGANLASLELKVFLATWARTLPSYTLPKQADSARIKWDTRSIIPRPADGVIVEVPNIKK